MSRRAPTTLTRWTSSLDHTSAGLFCYYEECRHPSKASMSTYSDGIPTSFDPALLNSEIDFLDAPASNTFSDDLTAIQQCFADEKAKQTSAGIVIQHRIWTTLDAFKSEEDYPIGIADG